MNPSTAPLALLAGILGSQPLTESRSRPKSFIGTYRKRSVRFPKYRSAVAQKRINRKIARHSRIVNGVKTK